MAGPPYFPVDERGWRMAMGMRPLDPATWLERGPTLSHELALKESILRDVPDTVIATLPSGEAASLELLATVEHWLTAYAPDAPRPVVEGDHPIMRAARWVQEDLCVLEKSDTWRLTAACVCFPSRWNLREKIGQTLDTIHEPIPGFAEHLASPTTNVFDRLTPERAFWRLNWTLLDDPTLHQPTSMRRSPEGDLSKWFFRVERQTIRALPTSKAVVFTIHNYVTSLADLRDNELFLEHLMTAIEQSPLAMKEYKGWVGVAEVLRAAL